MQGSSFRQLRVIKTPLRVFDVSFKSEPNLRKKAGSDTKDTVIVSDFLRLDLGNSLDNNAFKPTKNEVKLKQRKVVL